MQQQQFHQQQLAQMAAENQQRAEQDRLRLQEIDARRDRQHRLDQQLL